MKFLAVLLLLSSVLAAQNTAPKPASLAGSVTKYGSGEPVRSAEISVTRVQTTEDRRIDTGVTSFTETPQTTVLSDAAGHFQFPRLDPGDYVLVIRKNGFRGFRGPNSHSWQEALNVTLAPGQSITDLALAMQPGAVISGKVTDEEGEPMAIVQVNALKWVYANHRRQLRPLGMATTDDEGNYRMFALEPGRYIVRANVVIESGSSDMRYFPSYYPDTSSPLDANPINLRPGDQAVADFRMARGRAAKVSGHVNGGGGASQVQVYLHNLLDEGIGGRSSGTTTDRNGNFNFDGVTPGEYVIGALEFRPEGGSGARHAEVPLKIETDISNVSLNLEDSPGATLSGRLRVESSNAGHPPLSSLHIGLLPADSSTANGQLIGTGGYAAIAQDGSIKLDKISPGRYVVSMTADGSGWEDFYTKNVEVANRDVTDGVVNINTGRGLVPITVTVGVDGAYVEGTVVDEKNLPVAGATIVGVPEPALRSQFDLYQKGETDQKGHFLLRGIKPGRYSFYAWNAMEDESYMDPDFLARFEQNRTDLGLGPREHQTVQLRLLTTDAE